jgi:hypothetical protein
MPNPPTGTPIRTDVARLADALERIAAVLEDVHDPYRHQIKVTQK